MKTTNIVVFGIGYVGLSNAILLSQHNHVTAVDILPEKVEMINARKSPLVDKDIIEYLQNGKLDLTATVDGKTACKNAEFVIIATPTNYNPDKNYFDTKSVEDALEVVLSVNPKACIVIKSTVPVGYTHNLRRKYKSSNIIFSPEFLREGCALYDNLYPSRIIIGTPEKNLRVLEAAQKFALLLQKGALKENIPTLFMQSTEAEAVKLFANTYLAVRISYFNELDTYAQEKGLDAAHIIEGMCLDPRIGKHYNNPSFGYGGYCLPKDTKQLLTEYQSLPQSLVSAVVESNQKRKQYIADQIENFVSGINAENKIIGIFRLTMKANSDNFREASIIDVIHILRDRGYDMIIYEPTINKDNFEGIEIYRNLEKFKKKSSIIVANRCVDELNDIQEKLFTRDIYRED